MSTKKKRALFKICGGTLPFLGGGWKVIIAVKQHSQPYTVWNRGGGLFFQKKTSWLKWKGPKRQKSAFLINSKIPDCEPTSAAGELKKEVNVQI